jgi:hypothetical protein
VVVVLEEEVVEEEAAAVCMRLRGRPRVLAKMRRSGREGR